MINSVRSVYDLHYQAINPCDNGKADGPSARPTDVGRRSVVHREDLFSIPKFSSIPTLTLPRAKRGLHVCRSCYVDIERIQKLSR
jgi:hypothetical protein